MLESLKKNEEFKYQKLTPEEMTSKGILGRLVGPCADFTNPTRNGRKYGEQLWEKVFENPITIEKINNGVCFGELGHPADRTETDMEKIAICLREQPKKNSDGVLMAVFDILDTPNGRILKSLCDYGTKIGVSSRGQGDIIEDEDGNEMVDPETYDFECFDAVLVPAVECARMQYVTESLDKNASKLNKALCEDLNKATEADRKIMLETLNNLNIKIKEDVNTRSVWKYLSSFEDVVEFGKGTKWCVARPEDGERFYNLYLKAYPGHMFVGYGEGDDRLLGLRMPNSKGDIINIFDINDEPAENPMKIESIPEKGGDINAESETSETNSDKLEEANNDGSDELVKSLQEAVMEKSKLEAMNRELQEKLAVNDVKVKELTESLSMYKDTTVRLSKIALDKKDLENKVSTLEEELKVSKQTIERQSSRISSLVEERKSNSSTSKSLQESVSSKDKEIVSLNENLKKVKEEFANQISELNESIESLKSDSVLKNKEYCKKLAESNKMTESWKKVANDVVSHYIDSKAVMLGVTTEEIKNRLPSTYTIKDIDSICENLQSYALNVSKLPFSIDRKVKVKVHESKNEAMAVHKNDDDDVDDSLLNIAGIN